MDEKLTAVIAATKEQSSRYLTDVTNNAAPTTESIATELGMNRTAASRGLNQLFKEKRVIKINTRPVCFIGLEAEVCASLRDEYDGLDAFNNEYEQLKTDFILHRVIGWNRSLKNQIEQIKAGLMYPGNGLPMIIFGPSGTGKSYIARCAYDYAVSASILHTDAPFVTINCAQYANNPELLSSILFGYVRGAFTGANADKKGALEAANGGILFLDEVHRLSAEGQEKLFTYLDSGTFTPLGDDTKRIKSNCRLMFATTEPQDRFLETFLRRVPIKIVMPALQTRSYAEKKQIINSFISAESVRVGKPIEVTGKALDMLYQHEYQANVGEAKNLVKNIVATAYAQQLGKDTIEIRALDVPSSVYRQLAGDKKGKELYAAGSKTRFDGGQAAQISEHDLVEPIAVQIKRAWKYILKMDAQGVMDRQKYEYIVHNLMKHMHFTVIHNEDAVFKHTINEVRDILKLMQYGQEFYDNNNFVYGIASYIYYVLNLQVPVEQELTFSDSLNQIFGQELTFMKQLQPILEKQFETTLTQQDLMWLSIMIANEEIPMLRIPAVVMAHGYATASSIADTCNGMLHYPVFSAINMTPDASAEDMVNLLREVAERLQPQDGLVILIDMGSLTQIAKQFSQFASYSLLLVDEVSTPLALEVGNLLQQDKGLPDIRRAVEQISVSCNYYNVRPAKRNLIISTCMTGIGTAEQIRRMLVNSFKGVVKIDVVSVEFDKLRQGQVALDNDEYNLLAIIGIDDPHVETVPYMGLEDIISGNKMAELKQILRSIAPAEAVQTVEQQLVKNFSLTRVMDSLTVLSPDRVIGIIEHYLQAVQKELPDKLSNKVQIALYVHLGSMLERLVRGNGIQEYRGDNTLIVHDEIYSVLKKNISVLESEFMVKVTEPEIAYIREIITH
jgi:sigma-54 dependent transcriptional regulator of gfr operon